MAEAQAANRIYVERTTVDGDSNRSYMGLAAGFILSVMIVLGGFYVMINGHPWAGASVIGTQIAVIAGVFVYGTRSPGATNATANPSGRGAYWFTIASMTSPLRP